MSPFHMGTILSTWIRIQVKERNIKARTTAASARIGVATASDILTKGHIPRIDTRIRLTDYFCTPREAALTIAAGLCPFGVTRSCLTETLCRRIIVPSSATLPLNTMWPDK